MGLRIVITYRGHRFWSRKSIIVEGRNVRKLEPGQFPELLVFVSALASKTHLLQV